MSITFKENSTVAMYSGQLLDFNAVRNGLDIIIDFENTYDNSIIQFSLGGIVMTEKNDYVILDEKIRLYDRDESYNFDNITILVFKQRDEGDAL